MRSVIARLRRLQRAFGLADDGNIAVIFALACLPIVGLVGASIDYSQASKVRTDLQAAIDATALMVSKNAATASQTELQTSATSHFKALFYNPDAQNATVTATYSSDGGSAVTVTGAASMKTSFTSVIGVSKIDISASSTVKWGNSRLRVALVLDVTGSMSSSGKMTALKTATKNMLTQLKSAATTNGDVYVSIIPFAKDVNVDPSSYKNSWISWALWDAVNGRCSKRSRNNDTEAECLDDNGKWTPDDHNEWTGCVTDRNQDYDTTNTPPSIQTPATLFPAEQDDNCPVPIMALSYDWTALNQKISSMEPDGATNQPIGLQWGFQSLTSAPFIIPAKDPQYKYNEVIILLSDGLNTRDRWYGNGYSYSSQVDARQKILCNNVKTAGITIYTVQVNTGGDPLSTVLKACASGPDKFFLLTSANQMVTTFNQIGTALSNLRVAK
ncbi:MAG: pilus assembly protein [Xanthobacteraceae bacterium]